MGPHGMKVLCFKIILVVGLIVNLAKPFPVYAAGQFEFGGKRMSCNDAKQYRDTQLFEEFAQVYDNYDASKEERLEATLKEFRTAIKDIAKKWDQADVLFRKKVAVTWGGVLVGKIAEKSKIGVKANLTAQEKRAAEAVVNRGTEWTTVFSQYGLTGEADVKSLVAMPMTLLLTVSGFGVAEKVWSVGSAAMDTAFDLAEREIVKKEYNLTSSELIKRSEALIRKSQAAKVEEVLRFKNQIDNQCNK